MTSQYGELFRFRDPRQADGYVSSDGIVSDGTDARH